MLTNKLDLLCLEREDTQYILRNGNVNEVRNQIQYYEQLLNETRDLQRSAKRAKLTDGISVEEIKEWDKEITERKRSEEELYYDMAKVLDDYANEEREIAEAQAARYVPAQAPTAVAAPVTQQHARMPKLVISKFQGTHLDWFRFWNQFQAEIDSSSANQVTKFSYLKELLVPRVRLLVDGLPFSSEGYERAKNILTTKYGQASEVVNAYVQKISNLPTVHGTNPHKITEFYEALMSSVQTLESMGKLHEIKGYVRATLDKLPQLRSQLVQFDENWKEWEFFDLVEALRKWTERNPVIVQQSDPRDNNNNKRDGGRTEKFLQTNATSERFVKTVCVYCNSSEHKATDCETVSSVEERKKILATERLCFNCAGSKHQARNCRSKVAFQNCKGKHHTSICTAPVNTNPGPEPLLSAQESSDSVIYPMVIVRVNGVACRALLDTCAGSSYVSSGLIEKAGLKFSHVYKKRIEMMLHTTTVNISMYDGCVSTYKQKKFKLDLKLSKVDKPVLLTVPNPKYKRLIQQYSHLKGVTMDDDSEKDELPIHLVIGGGEFTKIKMPVAPRVGKEGEPIAELTKFGWFIMSPGKEEEIGLSYQTHSATCDYEELCKLDVLGLQETATCDDDLREKFREQLGRQEDGRYETSFLWTEKLRSLKSNEKGSLARLRSALNGRFKNDPELFATVDEIIQEQLKEGKIEEVDPEMIADGPICYMPHRPVVKRSAESTKVRIVFDASARENAEAASLNECVEVGPPLQNQLWDVVVRNRLKPVALLGDMKQAFHQIVMRKDSRDVLRFHWVKDRDPNKIIVLRHTRATFGVGESPFILNATVKEHLQNERAGNPEDAEIIDTIEDDLYCDDLTSGDFSVGATQAIKEKSIEVFGEAGIKLHKKHSFVS